MNRPQTLDGLPRRKRPIGRPSHFSEWLAQRIYHLARHGMTDAEIAWFLGAGVASLHRWKSSSVFRRKLQEAKAEADTRVEEALYKLAHGMVLREETVRQISVNEHGVATEETTTIREIPPHPGAIRLWLFNRQPDRWRANPVPNQDSYLPAINALPEIKQSETAKRIADAIRQVICASSDK